MSSTMHEQEQEHAQVLSATPLDTKPPKPTYPSIYPPAPPSGAMRRALCTIQDAGEPGISLPNLFPIPTAAQQHSSRSSTCGMLCNVADLLVAHGAGAEQG